MDLTVVDVVKKFMSLFGRTTKFEVIEVEVSRGKFVYGVAINGKMLRNDMSSTPYWRASSTDWFNFYRSLYCFTTHEKACEMIERYKEESKFPKINVVHTEVVSDE